MIVLRIDFATEARPEVIKNTILHEIAHAIVGYGVSAHGSEWKRMAMSIGCNGQRCSSRF